MPLQQPSTSDYTPPYQGGFWRRSPWYVKYVAVPLALGFTGMSGLLLSLRALPLPDKSFVDPTRVEAADGKLLAQWTLKGTRGEHVPLTAIPAALQNATIAVEDADFYHHHAFAPQSLARALLVDVMHGHVVEGGSTITQQLAKNLFLSQERTVGRKFHEALYAMQIELHEPKSTILAQYLNTVYYGHGAYGVAAAARLYFDKPVSDLSLAQCALLAGLPKGPSYYSPLVHPDAAKARQHIVLERMVKTGLITQKEADKAYQEPLVYHQSPEPSAVAPYFTSTAVHEAEERYHLTSDDLYRGGVRLSTTLDPVLQKAAEHAIATSLPANSKIEAALVAIDPQTGDIKAMVGGRDFTTSPYNRVFAERQPGSTFKAILYTSALAHGWTPTRQVSSEMTTFMYDKSKLYTVHDYGDFYAHRPLTLREAIAKSDNVYAVTTNLDVGPSTVIAQARAMGITTPLKPYPALALGVFPTSPVQIAAAYATLANGGYLVHPHTVSEVRTAGATERAALVTTVPGAARMASPDALAASRDRASGTGTSGDAGAEASRTDTSDASGTETSGTEVSGQRIVDSRIAFQMTDLMKTVTEAGGTGYRIKQYLHGPVASKTGTTDTDAWMVGYTPKIVCAVWVGYDNNKPLSQEEEHLAGPVWAKFMGTAQQRLPSAWFAPPAGLEAHVIDPVTGELATDTCGVTETDYFLPGTAPTEECSLHPGSGRSSNEPSGRGPATWWNRLFGRLARH